MALREEPSLSMLDAPLLAHVRSTDAKEADMSEAKVQDAILQKKPQTCFGHWPVWSEMVPLGLDASPDWAGVTANIGAGLIIGMREALGGIVSSSLVFSSAVPSMFPFGIGMMWYSTALGTFWYAMFGRLQYGYCIAQDIIGILQASMADRAVETLTYNNQEEQIPATVLAIIALSSILSGLSSFLLGKLGLGRYMLLFPTPVTSGFLGAIGFVILRSSLQTASGVKFETWYPVDMDAFVRLDSLAQLGLQLLTVCVIRLGPKLLKRVFPGKASVHKLGGLVCQLLPIALFYMYVTSAGISMATLTEAGWTYPEQAGSNGLWSTYSVRDADLAVVLSTVPDMLPLIMMTVLCTMAGVLAITDRFPSGPPGDPAPMETIDFDKELTTVGLSSVLLGLTGGTLTFHTFTAIQLRLDGGTHRIALMAITAAVGGAFMSTAPIGHFVPKWYLSGLFMNTAINFLKGALLSYRSLPTVNVRGIAVPSPQYFISVGCILISVFFGPNSAISFGLTLSIFWFLVESSVASPVSNVVIGNRVVSRTMRPFWELQTLREEGDRVLLLYLQGHLFFGSARGLAASLAAAAASDRVQFCILSFARVPQVDPSAAKTLKTAADRLRQRGCEIICCRMNHEVFSALSAAGLVNAPDPDLLMHLQGLRWRTVAMPGSVTNGSLPDSYVSRVERLNSSPSTSFVASPRGHKQEYFDAFAHETDALDYCDEYLIDKFFYGARTALEEFMLAYRAAARPPGVRLDEWAFEQMNGLPQGSMQALRGFCEIRKEVPQWTKMHDVKGSLCFILRGAVSLVQMLPTAEQISYVEPEVRGFSFRQGKKLEKRYFPGYVVGKQGFFLKLRGSVLDGALDPLVVVSSKLGESAEIWILRSETWKTLPLNIKGLLTEMLCVQLADCSRHSRLQER